MKIAIIGYSRFGQLWANILEPYGGITVFNRSDKSAIAKKHGYKYYDINDLNELSNMDIVFLAISIAATEEMIKCVAPHLKPGAIVMDVCSVKELPCQWMVNYLPKNIQIMGTHPMFGPDSYVAGQSGQQIVLCPVSISPKNKKLVTKIFKTLKLDVIITTPKKHDKQVAYSLAMVHLIGRTLDILPLYEVKIKSLGFERLMNIHETVSNDSWELFLNMHKYNPYAIEAKNQFITNLQIINKKIDQAVN